MGKALRLLPLFVFFSAFLCAQTELDARTIAAMYGWDYVSVPERETVNFPALLEGIWTGDDRYVFFVPENTAEKAAVKPTDIALILKTYYGWFYDRAAEPEAFAEQSERFLCTATTKEAERLTVTAEDLLNRPPRYDANGNVLPYESGAWELVVKYNGKKKYETRIPVAVIGNELYLDFVLRVDSVGSPSALLGGELRGYWQGVCKRQSIRLAPYPRAPEIRSYYVSDDGMYVLRFWETTMPYTDDLASFDDTGKTFSVAKHIVSSASIFTCVTGRSNRIRNIVKTPIDFGDYKLDETGMICVFGKPYMTKVLGKDSAPGLMQIVAEANSRRKDPPPPLFPPSDLNWHWDLIALLEKDNTLVREVRLRQRVFAETKGEGGKIDALAASMYGTHLKLQEDALKISDEARKKIKAVR
ncbi:hypothetical protein [Treponema sp. Marseille-Q4130]|uniref:hypothetical protein n=1 Tax=Treponema sp. Marseille-Q4130 TaxID=2766702 RepID=UPI0016529214|nr:hypothetical protein [Treponema sp. Marseille-Q4130]MBC6719536.1 hypothetical protein [Treponema sp. Marseille-Q4130]